MLQLTLLISQQLITTLTSGVATPDDLATLETFVKGSDIVTTTDISSNYFADAAGGQIATQNGIRTKTYHENLYKGSNLPAGSYSLDYNVQQSNGGISTIAIYPSNFNQWSSSYGGSYGQRYENSKSSQITRQDTAGGLNTFNFTANEEFYILITTQDGGGIIDWIFANDALVRTETADSIATTASEIIPAINELHTEVDALTVAVASTADSTAVVDAIATSKSEAISTAAADATAKADSAEADAKAYADQVVAATVDAAPATLDTLNELAAALGDDANFASTVTASIATKADDTATTAALADKASQVDLTAETTRATSAETINNQAIAILQNQVSGISTSSGSTDIKMTAEVDMDSNNIKNANDIYAARGFIDTVESNDLKVQTGTADFEGSIVNFGSATITGSGFSTASNNAVDNHINVSTANAGEFVKWNGTDYEWTDLVSGRLASDNIELDAGGSFTAGVSATLDFQNGLVKFDGSEVIVDTPTAPTHAANKSYVDGVVAATVDAAPAALDTLNELAAALGDDANFASTVTASIATKADDAATTAALATKANDAVTTAALATKATVTDVDGINTLLGKTEVAYYESMYSARDLGGSSSSSHSESQIGFDGGTSADTLRTSIHSQISSVSGVRRVEFLNNGTVTYGFVSPNDITSTTQYNSSMVRGELVLRTNGSNVGTGDPDAIHTNVYGTQYSTSVPSSQQNGSGVVSPASGHWPSFDTVKVYDSSGVQSEVTYSEYLTGNGFDSTGQPAGSVSFDTSSSTVSGAINELHTELNALSGTQSGDQSNLQTQITAEVARASSAEAVNAANIVSETSARTSADAALESDIIGLQNQVGTIISGSPASLDTLVEIVSAFETADASLSGVITANSGRLTTAENNIDALVADLTSEETARGAGDAALQANIDAEAATRSGLGSQLLGYININGAAITAEETARTSADSTLQSNIDTESSDRAAAITAEETARITFDASLQDQINALDTQETASKSSLESDINAEIARATAAESGLQSQISNVLSNTDATALNSLAEIVAEFQSADSTLTGAVAGHGTRLTSLESSTSAILAWDTDNVSEGTTNKYWTPERTKTALTGGLCITYNSSTGEIKIDEAETASSLHVASSTDANGLGGQAPSHYRIDVYDVNGTVVN